MPSTICGFSSARGAWAWSSGEGVPESSVAEVLCEQLLFLNADQFRFAREKDKLHAADPPPPNLRLQPLSIPAELGRQRRRHLFPPPHLIRDAPHRRRFRGKPENCTGKRAVF